MQGFCDCVFLNVTTKNGYVVVLKCRLFLTPIPTPHSGLIWAWRTDRHNRLAQQCQLILTEPVVPAPTGHRWFAYQLTVATGSHPNAGTSARIHVRLTGRTHATAALRLPNAFGRSFEVGAVAEYRVLTPHHFGRIDSVTLEVRRPAGGRPRWFCDWVRVRDVRRREEWLFSVRTWLGVDGLRDDNGDAPQKLLNQRTDASNATTRSAITVPLMSRGQFASFGRLVRQHLQQRLAGTSVWYGLAFDRRGRVGSAAGASAVRFTQVQRVTVATASFACGLLTNIMFFGRTNDETVEREQSGPYAQLVVTGRVLAVGFISVAIAVVFTTLVGLLVGWSERRRMRLAEAEQKRDDRRRLQQGGGTWVGEEDAEVRYRIMFADDSLA